MKCKNFRVWSCAEHAWCSPFMGKMAITEDGEAVAIAGKDVYPVWGKLVIEQYTGLKDKHGKAIYEGDIIRYTSENDDSFLGLVQYLAGEDYPAFDIPTAFIPDDWYFDSNVLSTGMAENSIEVVGNIHDNRDWVEVEK